MGSKMISSSVHKTLYVSSSRVVRVTRRDHKRLVEEMLEEKQEDQLEEEHTMQEQANKIEELQRQLVYIKKQSYIEKAETGWTLKVEEGKDDVGEGKG